jgi:hypothetical protein
MVKNYAVGPLAWVNLCGLAQGCAVSELVSFHQAHFICLSFRFLPAAFFGTSLAIMSGWFCHRFFNRIGHVEKYLSDGAARMK